MLILHGAWLPSADARSARFVFWGEASRRLRAASRQAAPARRGVSAEGPRLHPFGASEGDLRAGLATLGNADDLEAAKASKLIVRLPSADGRPLPSADLENEGHPADGASISLSPWGINVLALGADRAARTLISLDDTGASSDVYLADDLRYWIVASRFALELIYRQQFDPLLRKENSTYLARWRVFLRREAPLMDGAGGSDGAKQSFPSDWQRFDTLANAMPPVARALEWSDGRPEPLPRDLLRSYLDELVDALARRATPFPHFKMGRRTSAAEAWIVALSELPEVSAYQSDLDAFFRQYSVWDQTFDPGEAGADTFRVCFRLVPPHLAAEEADATESAAASRNWALQYLLQATDDPSLLVSADDVWRQRGSSAKFLNRKFDNPQERLLAGLGRASRLFPPIESSLRTARPVASQLTLMEAYDFVREKAMLMKSSGFGVLVPGLETKLGVRVRLGRKSAGKSSGLLDWDRIVDYDWRVALGDQELTREEFEALAKLKMPLVQVRGHWIELRPDQIEKALAFFNKQAASGQMSLPDAIKLSLAPDESHGLRIIEVTTEGWIDDLISELHGNSSEGRRPADEPPGFVGQLREYQKLGVSWLAALRRFGLGACLADDMGLGKTIQIIATLLIPSWDKESGPGAEGPAPISSQTANASCRSAGSSSAGSPALLVCPTSVVGNWRRELERFAPSMRVLVHHGAARNKVAFAAEAAKHDVVISTYALLSRDEPELAAVNWSALILDEAQNIKNSSTKAAQTARRLRAHWRTALTGTPVENRLADLWSIFEFLNPGYLGSNQEFHKRFADPIERARDASATARLKTLVSPFILRRIKSDRSIIKDLPEKNEMKVFCNLTREQVTLYEATLRESMQQIDEADGIKRRGLVLAMLTRLKQLCNHPALYLGDGSPLEGRSGKLNRLGEMLEEVLAVDDHALIFSQYASMGRMLKEHLEAKFGHETLLLHGATPAIERDRMVARFQSEGKGPRLFILSLKAGGTGLNLTRANHVFHFDRWWNPAVENQATDRAFRIGQSRNVQVHKFVCSGTFEEAIDKLIERKTELSSAIIGTSESWITEMSASDLRNLFALRRDATGEE